MWIQLVPNDRRFRCLISCYMRSPVARSLRGLHGISSTWNDMKFVTWKGRFLRAVKLKCTYPNTNNMCWFSNHSKSIIELSSFYLFHTAFRLVTLCCFQSAHLVLLWGHPYALGTLQVWNRRKLAFYVFKSFQKGLADLKLGQRSFHAWSFDEIFEGRWESAHRSSFCS